MINTWNPAELNQKINQLEATIKAQDVEANPTGEATETLTKIGIDGDIYSFTAETTAADVSYDNTSSDLTADDVQDAIDELSENDVEIIDIYKYATGTSPVIATGETIDITSDMYNIIASGNYMLRVNVCLDTSNGSSGRTSLYCDCANQWGVILNRTDPSIGMLRLPVNDSHDKLTLTTYGTTTFYVSAVKLIKFK